MSRPAWYALLAVAGIVASNQINEVLLSLLTFGTGCLSLGPDGSVHRSLRIVTFKMRRMGMIRWWHLVVIGAVGSAAHPAGQVTILGDICISGPQTFLLHMD